jgi:hypothetical protein
MPSATGTALWRRSLGEAFSGEEDDVWRRRLVTSLERLRERAALLAGEIARDLPDYTVHDASHSDALWLLADQIAGPDVTLTPTEAYVFGGACAIHDLGMAAAAYVDGPDSLRREPRWSDAVALALRDANGRLPRRDEIAAPGPDIERIAQGQVLRELHAEHAERLGTLSWDGAGAGPQWLIEDEALRDTYGPIVGTIAHSHWWAVSVLPERFPAPLGAPAGAPASWTVRPLLLACLLRLADASHLDGSRAPRFLRAVRRPSAASAQHWEFQEHLRPPYAKGDRYVFTGSPFGIEHADAWWLCAETLNAVHREFRAVDSLLADREGDRLAIRGVAGGDELERLAIHVPTDGWTPLDARVRVSNVLRLVNSLGGRELYGETPHVPLRELVQNATDAVRARRVLERRPDDWGEIVVRLGAAEADDARWLEVEDSGVGMSRAVLADHLLDFGTSFWDSSQVLEELPGLLGSAFEPTGRFGIGFFSVFMWGDAVKVTSRKYTAAQAQTYVLEFTAGVSRRPLLRTAARAEQLRDAGTRVAVRLDGDTLWGLGISRNDATEEADALARLCGWLAPALDTDLRVEAGDERLTAVVADDWQRMPITELAKRITDHPRWDDDSPEDDDPLKNDEPEESLFESHHLPPQLADNVRPLVLRDGTVVGRALLNPHWTGGGALTIGGLTASSLHYTTGILVGNPTTASRQLGTPIVPAEVLAAWATDQAKLLAGTLPADDLLLAAAQVRTCGGDVGALPIAITREGALTRQELHAWAQGLDEILMFANPVLGGVTWADKLELREKVVIASAVAGKLLGGSDVISEPMPESWPVAVPELLGNEATLSRLVRETVAEAWGVGRSELAFERVTVTIGSSEGTEVEALVTAIRRPAA